MSPTHRILLVDDDPHLCALVEQMLQGHGMALESIGRGAAGLAALRESRPDALLLDLDLPDMRGDEVMRRALELHPDLPVVVLTAVRDEQRIVSCVRAGASDYVVKPCDKVRLVTALHNALEHGRLRRELRHLSAGLRGDDVFSQFLGRSRELRDSVAMLQRAAQNGATLLLQGESDAGSSADEPASRSRSQDAPQDAIRPLADWERLLIEHALAATRGNVREASRRLGIGRTTMYRKMERYALEAPRPRRAS